MNIEYVRRETAKKNMGLTELPEVGASVTIAKNLEPVDFVGMIVYDAHACQMVMDDILTVHGKIAFMLNGFTYLYDPATGLLSNGEPSTDGDGDGTHA